MTPLYDLQARLTRLRRALALLRAGAIACAIVATAGLWLLVVFAVDWFFRLGVPERAAVMLLAAGGCVWAYFRLARPRLRKTGSERETALFVERQHEIDSDLVAALQFAGAANDPAASRRLSDAVVEYVARAAPEIDVFQGVNFGPLWTRFLAMLAALTLIAALAIVFPNHVAVFGQRLLLGSQAYASRTRIEQLSIGTTVAFTARGGSPAVHVAHAAEGQPLVFRLACSGVIPPLAVVQLRPAGKWGAAVRIELRPDPAGSGSRRGAGVLTGQLPRFVEPAQYTLTAGDAAAVRGEIEMIPLPIVELALNIEPPAYAAQRASPDDWQANAKAVLEGSSVRFAVQCTNEKPLKAVTVSLHGASGPAIACVPDDSDRRRWISPPGVAVLSNVRQELRYELTVLDDDGLSPQLPLRGVLRVRPDEAPTASLELVHRVVLPTAIPKVIYRAGDDFGIAGLELVVDVERVKAADASIENDEPVPATDAVNDAERVQPATVAETRRFALPLAESPLLSDHLPLVGDYRLDLAPLALAPGDRLKLTIEATDVRGENEPSTTVSEALILEVGDEKAVLAAIREADERSETQLNELIRSQLNIGKQP